MRKKTNPEFLVTLCREIINHLESELDVDIFRNGEQIKCVPRRKKYLDNEIRDKIIWNLYSVQNYSYKEISQILPKLNREWSYMNYDSIRKVIFREKKILKQIEKEKQKAEVLGTV